MPLPSLTLLALLIVGATFSGLLSATIIRFTQGWGGLVFPGALFGAVLAAYLWFGRNRRSAGVATAIVSESLAAHLVAVAAALISESPDIVLDILALDVGYGYGHGPRTMHALTIAGLVGGAGLSLGFCALLEPQVSPWRIALEVGACAAAGAWLGGAAPALVYDLTDRQLSALGSTVAVWQTGMALALGAVDMFRGPLDLSAA